MLPWFAIEANMRGALMPEATGDEGTGLSFDSTAGAAIALR